MAQTWLDWFGKHNNRVSFLDDNHAGGTIKHIMLLPYKYNQIKTFLCLGYYGTDELLKLAALDCNRKLAPEAFMQKYNKPFYATISVPYHCLLKPMSAALVCNFKFNKDTHGTNKSKPINIMSVWQHNATTNTVKITFNDIVMRQTKRAYNTWKSTVNVPFEQNLIFKGVIDRCLVLQ